MRKNSLTSNKGLSLSQAQSISNLCNQRAREIEAKLVGVNNYQKSIDLPAIIEGRDSVKARIIVVGNPLPTDVVELLIEKSKLHACQAFLMENIKAKDKMLNEAKRMACDTSNIEAPERPKTVSPLLKMLTEVGEEWGWSQLTVAEINEFTEAEAYAAHIGQFIHEGSTLDKLRKELGKGITPVEWMVIQEGTKSVVDVTVHTAHTPEKLLELHEKLAGLHRGYEQRVNYFKAKVKNLVTAENARIAKVNADAQNEAANINNQANAVYDSAYKVYSEAVKSLQAEYEKTRQAEIQNIASMRIEIAPRFQDTISTFLGQLTDVQE